ncbi:MAG: formate dehydrogenase accessory protein FdhE [Chloroflexota bacterium]|nr:formate dehydrogenase accessory protein FdhE [Chloroflexota bacterium]
MDTTAIDAAIAALLAPLPGRPEPSSGSTLAAELFELQRDQLAQLASSEQSSDLALIYDRLCAGSPAWTFEQLHIDPEACSRLWASAVELCLRDGALTSEQAEQLRRAGASSEQLMRLAAEWYEHPQGGTTSGARALLPEMREISTKPWLWAAAARARPALARVEWTQRVCPVCGDNPDVAVMHRDGRRTLVCGRCDTSWTWKPVGCPYCDGGGSSVEYHEGPVRGYYLQACQRCHRGLKTVDESVIGDEIVPAAERVYAAHLDDLAAQLNVAP